jgi:predicted AAA+ superfamily ATPase
MHGYIPRFAENEISGALSRSPAVAILGPRQCGKSTTIRLNKPVNGNLEDF